MFDFKYPAINDRFHTVRTLIVKDWRLVRVPVVSLVVLGILSYIVPVTAYLLSDQLSDSVGIYIEKGAIGGVYLTAVVAAAFGGLAIAGERANRTADFIAMLPVTRGQIVIGKWAVTFWAIAWSATFHTIVAIAVEYLMMENRFLPVLLNKDSVQIALLWFGSVLALFGVAWLFGTLLRSAAIATCISIGLALSTVLWVEIYSQHRTYFGLNLLMQDGVLMCFLGLVGMIGGTVYYLRRTEP